MININCLGHRIQNVIPPNINGLLIYIYILTKLTKLRGLSPHANYTDRAAAAGQRS